MRRTRLYESSDTDGGPPAGSAPAPVVEGIWHRTDRPKVVGLIGWLLMGMGYLGFVLRGAQIPVQFGFDMRWLNPDFRPMHLNRVQFAVGAGILVGEMALGLFSIAAGVGALKMREWGRRAVVAYGLTALVATLLKAAWQVHMFDFMLDYQASSTTQPFDREHAGNLSFFALITVTFVQLAWCVALATVMTRRGVRDAFAAAGGSTPDADAWRSATH